MSISIERFETRPNATEWPETVAPVVTVPDVVVIDDGADGSA